MDARLPPQAGLIIAVCAIMLPLALVPLFCLCCNRGVAAASDAPTPFDSATAAAVIQAPWPPVFHIHTRAGGAPRLAEPPAADQKNPWSLWDDNLPQAYTLPVYNTRGAPPVDAGRGREPREPLSTASGGWLVTVSATSQARF